MAINPNISLAVRGIELQDPLAQYSKVMAIQNAQQQNALAQQQMAAAKRAEEATTVQNELMAKHFDPATGGVNINALAAEAAQRGQGGIIPGLLKTETERQSAAATLKKTQGDIEKNQFDLQNKKFNKAWQNAGSAATPQIAIEQLTKAVRNGEIDMTTATREIQNLQNMPPEQYREWRASKILSLMDAKDQLSFMLPKVTRQEAGGQILSIQDNPMMPGYGQPIAGAAITKTPTIGEITGQGQLAVARQRLAQDAQGVTYQQDAQGNLIAVPTRLAAGATPTAIPVTGEGGAPVKGKGSKELAVSEQQASYNIGRILDAAKEIAAAIKKDPSALKPGVGEAAASSVGLSGTANVARNAQRQIVFGAQRDALDAMLYLATGAAYNKEQLEGQMAAYVPAFTDKPDAVEAKRIRMLGLIQNAKVRAGKAWTPEMDAASQVLFQPIVSGGKPAAPPASGRPEGVGADWTLMTDKNNNRAWVSPDRKSFKEVK